MYINNATHQFSEFSRFRLHDRPPYTVPPSRGNSIKNHILRRILHTILLFTDGGGERKRAHHFCTYPPSYIFIVAFIDFDSFERKRIRTKKHKKWQCRLYQKRFKFFLRLPTPLTLHHPAHPPFVTILRHDDEEATLSTTSTLRWELWPENTILDRVESNKFYLWSRGRTGRGGVEKKLHSRFCVCVH